MREAKVEATFRRLVREMGGMTEKMIATNAGVPDRMVILPGQPIELVELKDEGGKTSAVQDLWHLRAYKRGTDVTVLTGEREVRAWAYARKAHVIAWMPTAESRRREQV